MKFWEPKVQPTVEEVPMETPKKKSYLKPIAISLGVAFGVAHIGVLGHLMNATRPQFPVINFPTGDYASYKMRADREGYSIEYKANDPAILNSERQLQLNKKKGGLFGGGGIEMRREYRHDQYTMDGTRNLGGGALDPEGKLGAKAKSASGRTLEHGLKVPSQGLALLLVPLYLLSSTYPT